MAYSIGGVPIILDSGSVSVSAGQSITAPELYVIRGGEALGVATASAAGDIVAPSVETESFTLSGTTTTAIVTSGINTVAPTGDIVTENAVAQAIIPLIGSVNDALNPTDADFSSTDSYCPKSNSQHRRHCCYCWSVYWRWSRSNWSSGHLK